MGDVPYRRCRLPCETQITSDGHAPSPSHYASLPTKHDEGILFSGCLSVRPSLTPVLCDAIYIFTQWRDFSEICHKYSSCEWALLNRVKGQLTYNGGGIHFDGVASRLTCLLAYTRDFHRYSYFQLKSLYVAPLCLAYKFCSNQSLCKSSFWCIANC